jgi:DNA-binding transcriptional MerR regulator
MVKKYLNAQAVAQKLGISKKTLVRYENKGIFPKPKRNLVNGWREYTDSELGKLEKILGRI